MFHCNTKEILSLLCAVKYTYRKNTEYDYSKEPRPCHNLVFMLEGEGTIEAGDKTLTLRAGNILFIPKNTTYICRWRATPQVVFHSLHFSFLPKTDPFFSKDIPLQLLPHTDFSTLYASLKQIETNQYSKNTDAFLTLAAFFTLCGKLFPLVETSAVSPEKTPIYPALQYIETHYAAPISINKLASLCFLSPSRFFALFKAQTGYPPIVYKNRIAIQYAMQELLGNKSEPISAIAQKHGFASAIYFARLFKKVTGKTPTAYRKHENLL